MIERIKEELDTAQTRLRDASDRLGGQGADWVRTARHQVHLARGESQERLWKLEHRALDLADDCLLYTSPSPRDATLSRMPSSA